jgi:hypothetical protein
MTAPRIPTVSLVIELEADPRLIVDAANDADREALRAWVREVRPDIDRFLRAIAIELHDRQQAA